MLANKIAGRDYPVIQNSFISDKNVMQYQKSLDLHTMGQKLGSWAECYPHTDPELVQLLELMLEYNPAFRPSAAHLLKMPIFDDIRVKDLERWAQRTRKIIKPIDFDRVGDATSSHPNDIDEWRNVNYQRNHKTIEHYREALLAMVAKFG